MGTRHLYWILTGPSFAVRQQKRTFRTNFLGKILTDTKKLVGILTFLWSRVNRKWSQTCFPNPQLWRSLVAIICAA
jgi:hypothetical protein